MKKLSIENFKSYKRDTVVEFSNITINVGMNSVGKSTVTQSVLLIRQLYESMLEGGKNKGMVRLNGYCDTELGQYQDIVSDPQKGIRYTVDDKLIELNKKDDFSIEFKGEGLSFDSFFENEFYYINAERIGPRNYHVLSNGDERLCGIHGEYTYEMISNNLLYQVDAKKMCPDSSGGIKTLPKQIEAWMSYIAQGLEFDVNQSKENRIASMRMRQTIMDMDKSSPYNFGFGISYLLSIIVTCLLAGDGATVIIENPEAHLHPAAQSYIGRFLAQMSDAGQNILIETHSEHVVNGIRIYGLKKRIPAGNICINYFNLTEDGTAVQRISLDEDMNIKNWPEGFFDQEEKDMMELRRLRKTL